MRKNVRCALAGLTLAAAFALGACSASESGNGESSSAESSSERGNSGNDAESAGNAESKETADSSQASDGALILGKYPADINKWTCQNFIDYFTEAGVFKNEDWIWTQDHSYWTESAVNEGCGYMDEEGAVMICIYTFDPESTEADVPAFLDYVRENKKFTDELSAIPIDHMIGNVVFTYIFTTDEEVYNAMDEAYNKLVADLNATPEF